MADDLVARTLIKRLRFEWDQFRTGSSGVNLPGGILAFRSIPLLISETRSDIGLALCTGSWEEDDGNISLWCNLGSSIVLTPRSPNGTSIIATAGGIWMWRVSFEEFLGVETVITPPAGMPFTTSFPMDFDTIAAAKLSSGSAKTNNILADNDGNFATFLKVGSLPAGTEDVDWYINAAGIYYERA